MEIKPPSEVREDLEEQKKWANKNRGPRHEGDWKYCHVCGYRDIVYESLAESYWCPECGSSDLDE